MKFYTPFEYCLIDLANNLGKDKITFEERIAFSKQLLQSGKNLRSMSNEPLYLKSLNRLKMLLEGKPIHSPMGLDGTASGQQVLGAALRCYDTLNNVNLVDPTVRKDVYSYVPEVMNQFMDGSVDATTLPREMTKKPFMTLFYGSTAQPKLMLGNGMLLRAFYQAAEVIAPEPYRLARQLTEYGKESGKEYYVWYAPNGDKIVNYSTAEKKYTVEMPFLHNKNGKPSSFSYKKHLRDSDAQFRALAANVTHCGDADLVEETIMRATVDRKWVKDSMKLIENRFDHKAPINTNKMISIGKLLDTTISNWDNYAYIYRILKPLSNWNTFDVGTIHDEVRSLPQYCNRTRWLYRERLAELGDSTWMEETLRSITDGAINLRLGDKVGNIIRQSAYGLC